MTQSRMPQQVFEEMNLCRSYPARYAEKLAGTLQYYNGNLFSKPGCIPIRTQEGANCVNDCISQLQMTSPLPLLNWSPALARAAQSHADDTGPKGLNGHRGSDGSDPGSRVNRFGSWQGNLGETLIISIIMLKILS